MYDGPQAGLVRFNLVVGCVALIPVFLGLVLVLAQLTGNFLGDYVMIPALIAAIILGGIGGGGYILAIPYFLFALIFLRRLLRSQEIPPQVRKRTALFVEVALLVMFLSCGLLYLAYRGGRFKGLFT